MVGKTREWVCYRIEITYWFGIPGVHKKSLRMQEYFEDVCIARSYRAMDALVNINWYIPYHFAHFTKKISIIPYDANIPKYHNIESINAELVRNLIYYLSFFYYLDHKNYYESIKAEPIKSRAEFFDLLRGASE